MPISSRLTAADSISQSPATPSRFTSSFMIYSAIGLRHIFPWQIKVSSPKRLLLFSIISHRAAIVTQFQNPRAPTIPVNGMRARFSGCKFTPPNGILLAFHPAGISIMRSCSLYCGSCGLAIRQQVSKLLLDGAVRAFRVVCYLYHSRFSISRNVFSRNAVLRERNAESPTKAKIGSLHVRRSSFCRNSGRLLRNRYEKS